MMKPTPLPHRAWQAALLLCLAPFAGAQTVPSTMADPLTVENIGCVGNEGTSCDFIRDHLYLQPGDSLDEEEVRNAELRLSSLRNFASVKIRLEKGARRGAVIVVIEVDEASPITTEWLLGGSSRPDSRRAVLAARVGYQNLFGEGKTVDLTGIIAEPVGGDDYNEGYDVTLRYADPQLFGSRRYFAIASIGTHSTRYRDRFGNFTSLGTTEFDLRVGRRFGDFSYVTIGASHRPDLAWTWGRWESDGAFRTKRADPQPTKPNIAYGWSTEDDLHFPTHGTSFHIAAGDGSPLQFRKTMPLAGAFWTFKIGGDPSPEYRRSFNESQLLSLTYARPVTPGDNILRGRWYVEPGVGFLGYAPEGRSVYEYGLKAGFRAETRLFGLVDLYLIARKDTSL
jgi:outer membrane protein assembly factor BamA